ncbi:hypothetical protein GCM10010844_35620 [Deinococcus radiotolerans]|uniref:Uncharacterized protein n=1 Tax=Deinococcus radiotolerans TaxID=1309407 RepID=A0ABQ2FPB8_9DEIO|nr:hypothetical protein GCM10010844_35620 [Deinococcus radiotolerans]
MATDDDELLTEGQLRPHRNDESAIFWFVCLKTEDDRLALVSTGRLWHCVLSVRIIHARRAVEYVQIVTTAQRNPRDKPSDGPKQPYECAPLNFRG